MSYFSNWVSYFELFLTLPQSFLNKLWSNTGRCSHTLLLFIGWCGKLCLQILITVISPIYFELNMMKYLISRVFYLKTYNLKFFLPFLDTTFLINLCPFLLLERSLYIVLSLFTDLSLIDLNSCNILPQLFLISITTFATISCLCFLKLFFIVLLPSNSKWLFLLRIQTNF